MTVLTLERIESKNAKWVGWVGKTRIYSLLSSMTSLPLFITRPHPSFLVHPLCEFSLPTLPTLPIKMLYNRHLDKGRETYSPYPPPYPPYPELGRSGQVKDDRRKNRPMWGGKRVGSGEGDRFSLPTFLEPVFL